MNMKATRNRKSQGMLFWKYVVDSPLKYVGCIQRPPDWPPGAKTAYGTGAAVSLFWSHSREFAVITLRGASQQVFIVVISLSTLPGNF
jgi:hypothetical protein